MKGVPLKRPIWAVGMVLVGVALLVLKRHYHGPLAALVQSYLGNVSASFAVYFIASFAASHFPLPRLMAALAALAAVEFFELLDGFGVMSNIYDPWDLVANAVGIGVAFGIDWALGRPRTPGE